MVFTPERRTISKYQRESVKVTDKHIDDIFKWITDRDIMILRMLLAHPFLTIDQVEMMCFANLKPSSWRTKANERIGRLYNSHCIDRFFPPVKSNAGSSPQHLILDYAGAKVLQRAENRTEFKFKKRTYVPQTYKHYLKIIDFKAILHVLDRQLGVVDGHGVGKIVSWQTERILKFHYTDSGRVRQMKLIPDAFCIYNYAPNGRVKLFYLECDNATEPIETLKGKILNYKRYFESGEWKTERWARILNVFPAILFVAHDQDTIRELISYTRSLRSNIKFLFTTYDSLYVDTYKEYISSIGKRRLVLQERKVKILDDIWQTREGLSSL